MLAKTNGYQTPTGEYVIDPRAAKAALKVLTSMLNLRVDMEPMDKQDCLIGKVVLYYAGLARSIPSFYRLSNLQ